MISNLQQKLENNKFVPFIYITLSCMSYTVFTTVAKMSQQYIHPLSCVTLMSLFRLLINTFFMKQQKVSVYYKNQKINKYLIWRSIFGCISFVFAIFSLKYAKISEVSILLKMASIWATIIAIIHLKEKTSKTLLFCICISFIGIIFLVQPSFLFVQTTEDPNLHNRQNNEDYSLHYIGLIMGLFSGIGGGIVSIFVKKLASLKVHNTVQMQHTSVYGIVMAGVLQIILQVYDTENIDKDNFGLFSPYNMFIGAIIGVTGWGGLYFSSKAIMYDNVSVIIPFAQMEVFFSFLVDIFYFGNSISFFSVIGSLLIVFANVLIILQKAKKKI